MKKLKFIVEVECKDSTNAFYLISGMNRWLLCDDVRCSSVEWEEYGVPVRSELENPDFKEE